MAPPMTDAQRQKLSQEGLFALDSAMTRLTKQMEQGQIKRRLSSIRTQRLELAADIQKARRQKKSRKGLYAEMETLTNEALRLEGMLK